LSTATAVTSTTTEIAAGQRRAKQAFAKMVFPPASRCRHAFQLASTDVERRPDGSRYLRAVIRPAAVSDGGVGDDGRQIRSADERVVVRAAGRGSRLVVGAYRPEPLGDGTNYLRQVCVCVCVCVLFTVYDFEILFCTGVFACLTFRIDSSDTMHEFHVNLPPLLEAA